LEPRDYPAVVHVHAHTPTTAMPKQTSNP